MKFPYIQLFPADLRSDPNLSRCSISARGVWFEFLMVMHMDDRCGLISGTREELARDARCTTVEVSTAINEFDRTKTADVTERNGVVTVINRRMRRDWEARKKGLERVKRHRESSSVTHVETRKPLLDIDYGDGDGSSVNGESEGKPKPETFARVALHFLNEKAGRSFRETDSNLSPIIARLESVKMDIDGVKMMISRQVELWKGDPGMDEFLCPSTLFRRSNFDKYYDNRHLPILALKKPPAQSTLPKPKSKDVKI